jgi:beta-galactosidase GanA
VGDGARKAANHRRKPRGWITHNFMGFFNEFDHWLVGNNLNFASWDSYRIGLVERFRSATRSVSAGQDNRISRHFTMTFIGASVGGVSG